MNPKELKYSKNHMWVNWDESEGMATMGITDYAQSQLEDIVFFELPEIGTKLTQFEKLGEVESIKAVSDLISPLSGEIKRMIKALLDSPELAKRSLLWRRLAGETKI